MNQATLEELNKEFLEKKKKNPAKLVNSCKELTNLNNKVVKEIKSYPKTVKQESDNSYYKIFRKMGIPERYKRAKLSDFSFFDTKLLKYFRLLEKAIYMGRGLVVCGDYETGKTHFVFALAKEIIKTFADEEKEKSKIPKFVEFADFLTDIRIRDNGETLDTYFKADVLIIDDFFSIDLEDWELSKLTNIVSKRYNAKKTLIITSNIKPKEIIAKAGRRLWERIKAVSYTVEFTADNFKGCRQKYDSVEWDNLN